MPSFASASPSNTPRARADPARDTSTGRPTSRGDTADAERVEQSFGLKTGRYRRSDGEFAEGSPPNDYNAEANRFQSEDGDFKDRSADLGSGTPWDAPEDDAETTFDGGLFDY